MDHCRDRADWQILMNRICEVNDANRWDRPTLETLPTKIMLVVTELDEAVQYVHGFSGDPIEVEVADAAIRLLHILGALWPDQWWLRGTTWAGGPAEGAQFKEVERLLWPIVGQLCHAVEAWRDDRGVDVKVGLECAFGECRRLARILDFDLFETMAAKVEVNAKRGKLHGRVNSAG